MLVADIGGTNARFCIVDANNFIIRNVSILKCQEHETLLDAINYYLNVHQLNLIEYAVIAIACPITGDWISMTNHHWDFSVQALKQQLQFKQLAVINDFSAIAMALPLLQKNELVQIGPGQSHSNQTRVVLGAGTGLGVAYLKPHSNGYIPLAGEGGHIEWAPENSKEWFIKQYLLKRYNRISIERLLSGPGIENIYQALSAFHNLTTKHLTAAEIAELALNEQSELATETIQQFFATLGSVAGDFTLIMNALGGVYLAGGIVPKLLPLIRNSEFRSRFESKGRFQSFNKQISTSVITTLHPGLQGAAAYLKQICFGDNNVKQPLAIEA